MNKVMLGFIIYAFLGWVVEVSYVYVTTHKLENRGFFYMPIVPIYSFGAVIIIFFLDPFFSYPILLFVMAIFLTTGLEYFTSFIMEYLFNMHWWDYSKHKYNINGRVCLENSILFGILSLIVIYLINPIVINFINSLSNFYIIYIINFFLISVIFDLYYTLRKLETIGNRDIKLISSKVYEVNGQYFDTHGRVITKRKMKVNAKLSEIVSHPIFITIFILIIVFSVLLLKVSHALAIGLSTFDALVFVLLITRLKQASYKLKKNLK